MVGLGVVLYGRISGDTGVIGETGVAGVMGLPWLPIDEFELSRLCLPPSDQALLKREFAYTSSGPMDGSRGGSS